jgi:tetratricopeptide (TPR) repeat protein
LGTLCSFSLARRKDVGGCFSFHTLVQTWARTRRKKPDRQGFAEKALLVIAGAIKGLAAKTELDYGTSYRLLAHIDRCQKYLGSEPCNPEILHSTRAYLLLGRFCCRCGRFDQAMTWFERDLGEIANKSIVEQLETEDCIATTLLEKGDDVKAMEAFRRLHDSALNHLGKDHDLTVDITNSLGILSKRMGRFQEAVCWYRSALKASTRKFGDADQRTLATMNNIAVIQKELSQFSDSLETLNTVLARKEAALGENNSSTLETVMNIGVVYMHLKEYEKALHFLRRARDGKELISGKSHPKYLDVVGNIANVYVKQGQLDEAIGFYKDLLHRYQTIFGDEHPRVHTTADLLGEVYSQQGNYEESLDWYRKALEGRRSRFGEESVLTLGTVVNIACVLDIQDLFVDAMLEYKKALDGFRNTLGPDDLRAQTIEHRLRTLLLRWAEYESR